MTAGVTVTALTVTAAPCSYAALGPALPVGSPLAWRGLRCPGPRLAAPGPAPGGLGTASRVEATALSLPATSVALVWLQAGGGWSPLGAHWCPRSGSLLPARAGPSLRQVQLVPVAGSLPALLLRVTPGHTCPCPGAAAGALSRAGTEERLGERQLVGSRRGRGWLATRKVCEVWARSTGWLPQGSWQCGREAARGRPEMKESQPETGPQAGQEARRLQRSRGAGAGGGAGQAGGFSRGSGAEGRTGALAGHWLRAQHSAG